MRIRPSANRRRSVVLENSSSTRIIRHDPCIDESDLERYLLGMATEETELAGIEEHLLWCEECLREAEKAAAYADAMRAGIIAGNFSHSRTRLTLERSRAASCGK